MGTFISMLGNQHILEDKVSDFLNKAERIAWEGGMFTGGTINIFGKRISLLTFPDFHHIEEKYADWYWNYFEYEPWENAGVELKTGKVYSDKVGWKQFNIVTMALYTLAEIYSDTPCLTAMDGHRYSRGYISWLRYLFDEDLQFTFRNDHWRIYEILAEEQEDNKYRDEVEVSIDEINNLLVSYNDHKGAINTLAVTMVLNEFNKDFSDEGNDKKFNLARTISSLLLQLKKYKGKSAKSEKEQIQDILSILICSDEERKKAIEDEELGPIANYIAMSSPQIITKAVAEVYEKNFWELWKGIRNNLTIDMTNYYNASEDIQKEELGLCSTNEFLNVKGDDRIYWWKENSDVTFSDKIECWFEELKEMYGETGEASGVELDLSNTTRLQKRLTNFLYKVNCEIGPVFAFSDMFYEFLGNFHKAEYAMVVVLMEKQYEKIHDMEEVEQQKIMRDLLSLLANKELRMRVFEL